MDMNKASTDELRDYLISQIKLHSEMIREAKEKSAEIEEALNEARLLVKDIKERRQEMEE